MRRRNAARRFSRFQLHAKAANHIAHNVRLHRAQVSFVRQVLAAANYRPVPGIAQLGIEEQVALGVALQFSRQKHGRPELADDVFAVCAIDGCARHYPQAR